MHSRWVPTLLPLYASFWFTSAFRDFPSPCICHDIVIGACRDGGRGEMGYLHTVGAVVGIPTDCTTRTQPRTFARHKISHAPRRMHMGTCKTLGVYSETLI